MQMTTLDRIYPRDRLSIADNPWHAQDAEKADLPELLAYLIETKLNLNLSHRMVIEISRQVLRVKNVTVYSGTEEIGTLSVDMHQGKINLSNHAITRIMVRKGYMASGKAISYRQTTISFFALLPLWLRLIGLGKKHVGQCSRNTVNKKKNKNLFVRL